jgi:outer membrane protein assembly factor BamB
VRLTDTHLVVAEEDGRVLLVDAESGEPVRQAVLPQGIATSVGVAEDGETLIVVGDHSNLYALSADTLACRGVAYLGQKPETVQVPPVECLGHLLVFENTGLDFAQVHVLARGEDGEGWQAAQKPLRLQHNVVVEPVVTEPHVICLTDYGSLNVFEMNPAEADQPLREVAKTQASSQDALAGAMLYESGHLWVADVQLTRYRVNLTLGQIERAWVDHQGDRFQGWLSQEDRVIFYARWPRNMAGTRVAALQVGGGGAADRAISPLWSTDIAVPPAGPPISDRTNGRLVSVSTSGDAFFIDAPAVESGRCTQPAFRLGPQIPAFAASAAQPLDGGRWAFAGQDGPPRWLLFDPPSMSTPFRFAECDVPGAAMSTPPVAFGSALLVPLDNGQLRVVDPATGEQKAHPFQPPLRPGQTVTWRAPCVLPDGKQFVIADGDGNLHRVGIEPGTPPLLKGLASGRAAGGIRSALVATGGPIFAVVERGDRDVLASFHPQELQTVAAVELAGHVTRGPERVGQLIAVATDNEGLLAFNEAGETLWKVPLAGAVPAGPPVPVEGSYVLATTDGRVRRLSAEGNVEADVDTGEPIARGPVVQGGNLIVSGPAGTLRILPLPKMPSGG